MPPQAPAPMPPEQYDFIMNPDKKPRRKLGSGGKKQRIMVVVAGAVGAIMLIVVVFSVLSSSGKGEVNALITIAQQQTEIIRIATLGTQKARTADASNLAVTTQLSLQSAQPPLLKAILNSGHKTKPAELALGHDAKTDLLLTQATQSNNFDEVFTKTLQTKLLAYQKALKAAYDGAGKKTKATLAEQYKSASLLITTKTGP